MKIKLTAEWETIRKFTEDRVLVVDNPDSVLAQYVHQKLAAWSAKDTPTLKFSKAPISTFRRVIQDIKVTDLTRFWLHTMVERKWAGLDWARQLCLNGRPANAVDRHLFVSFVSAAYDDHTPLRIPNPQTYVVEELEAAIRRFRNQFDRTIENLEYRDEA